jgi:hypothetical protein
MSSRPLPTQGHPPELTAIERARALPIGSRRSRIRRSGNRRGGGGLTASEMTDLCPEVLREQFGDYIVKVSERRETMTVGTCADINAGLIKPKSKRTATSA